MTKGSTTVNTLVFDWGDTLMKTDRRFSGPMVDWPAVQALDGAQAALARLKPHFRLVVATNAADSNAGQVQAALQRAGLDQFFSRVFTFQELRARKPGRAFFRAIERELNAAPEELAMVGDDYWSDASGACQASWRAVWLNPGGALCPGLTPPHDAEVRSLAELPDIIPWLALPTLPQCLGWLQEQGAPFNLLQHVQMVAAISYALAAWLRNTGQGIDPILAQRGGLLHDLARISVQKIDTTASHAEVAASLLRESGQFELAEIARKHILHAILSETDRPSTWEEKVVYFADKLAESGQLAPLLDRLEALAARYPAHADSIHQSIPAIQALEREIAAAAGISDLFGELKRVLHSA